MGKLVIGKARLFSVVPYNEELRRVATLNSRSAEIELRDGQLVISSPNLDLFPVELNETIEGINKRFSELLKVNTQKLYVLLSIWLGKHNSNKTKEIQTTIKIPLSEIYKSWGLSFKGASKQQKRKISVERIRLKKSLVSSVKIICSTTFELKGKSKRGKIEGVATFGSRGIFEGSYLIFHFDDLMAYSLLNGLHINLPSAFFQIDGNHSRALSLLQHLSFLASQDNNVLNNRHDIVGIPSVIEACGYPRPDEIKHRNYRYIRDSIKRDLDYLQTMGVIKWHWCSARKEQEPDDLHDMPFTLWLEKIYIYFEFVGAPSWDDQVKAIKARQKKTNKLTSKKKTQRKPK